MQKIPIPTQTPSIANSTKADGPERWNVSLSLTKPANIPIIPNASDNPLHIAKSENINIKSPEFAQVVSDFKDNIKLISYAMLETSPENLQVFVDEI